MHLKCVLLLLLVATSLPAQVPPQIQQPPPDITPGAIHTAPRTEPVIEGFVRRDRDSVTLALTPEKKLVLHDFDFDGEPVDTSKLHLRLISPGVYELSSVAWTVGYWRFHLEDAASYYGLGEHFDTLDHAHTVVHNLSQDNPGNKGSSTYKPIPFYLSTTGYGLWLDTTADATFDLNVTEKDQLVVDSTSNHLRIVFFTGEASNPGRFPDLLAAFTQLASPAPSRIVPPYWAFAPWQARDFHRNAAEVLEDVDRTRQLGLPASVILIDSPWATAYNSYVFNPKQFDDAPGMIKHLHQAGYKLVLWHTPWINNLSDAPKEDGFAGKIEPLSPNYAVAAERGFFVKDANGKPWTGRWWKGEGSLVDFTNPKAKQWWQEQVGQAVAAGADGFKDDDGEGSFLGQDVTFFDHSDPRMMRNRYGSLYNNAVEEVIQRDLHGNGVLFARSVSTGANGLGFLWAGDNEGSFSPANGLPAVVTAGLSAGLSGMPLWAADLGGYLKQPDTPNPLLLQRWTEFAAFSPVMEVMSQANLAPWTFDRAPSTTALETYRKYAILHMSLFPYRYAAAQQAAANGVPILRALVFDYQDDLRARTVKDEYLFGPDLLVAPVIDENTTRVVYLPAGEWLDLGSGQAFTGPRTVIVQAPPDTIPVFARRGSILPKIPEDVMTLVPAAESGNKTVPSLDNRRVFEILGGPAATETTLTDFEGRVLLRSGNTLKITSHPLIADRTPEKTHIILRWRFITPHTVSVDGAPVSLKMDRNGIPTAEFDLTLASTITWQ